MKTQLTTLKRETKHCKICFEPFTPNTYSKIGVFEQILCKKCLKKFKHRFIHYQIEGIKALAIYDYDENMRQLIYQFKGCGDYELYPVFLNSIKDELKMMYYSYQIIPIPSYIKDDEKREFNHVREIFSVLGLPILDALEKIDNFKQSDHTANGRKQIKEHLKVRKDIDIRDKKILIVDDISTTGNTLKAAVTLIQKLHPKKIRILTLCKRELIEND